MYLFHCCSALDQIGKFKYFQDHTKLSMWWSKLQGINVVLRMGKLVCVCLCAPSICPYVH